MAVSKFATWSGAHSFSVFKLYMKYDVYADMANSSAKTYLRLSGCQVQSLIDVESVMKALAPLTIKIQIDGAGKIYSFNTGDDIKHRESDIYDGDTDEGLNGYYYIDFSDNTDVLIPKDGTEFKLNLTITTKSKLTFTVEESCCGPVSCKLTGSSDISTGNVATYTLLNPLVNDATHEVEATMHVHFPSEGQIGYTYDGYESEYVPANSATDPFTKISFVPLRHNATVGDVTKASEDNNHIVLYYYYYTNDDEFGVQATADIATNRIVIGYYVLDVKVTARNEVNASLKPVFDDTKYLSSGRYGSANNGVDYFVNKYGAAVQGETYYRMQVRYLDTDGPGIDPYPPYMRRVGHLKYGASFVSCRIIDSLGETSMSINGIIGETVSDNDSQTSASVERTYVDYDRGLIKRAGAGLAVQYRLVDSYGFTTIYTDRIDAKAYSQPQITVHNVRRCSVVSEGSGDDIYSYDGVFYKVDDYGEYALIEWGVRITPLDDTNSKRLTITTPSNPWGVEVSVPSYECTGYRVVPADPERSYNIRFKLTDDFHTVQYTVPLNTVLACIDFLHGGTGIAFGKIAELEHTLDVRPDWLLKMPYGTKVLNYNDNGSYVRLYEWMQTVESRIQWIINNRDIAIWHADGAAKMFDGNDAVCIPSNYGVVTYPYLNNNIHLENTKDIGITGMLIGNNIKVARKYIYVKIEWVHSFAGAGTTPSGAQPSVYILSSKPTSIDQTTGVPNGTVLGSVAINGTYDYHGSVGDYISVFTSVGHDIYFDATSWQGTNIWIVVTVRNGESSHGYTKYSSATVDVDKIAQTNYGG